MEVISETIRDDNISFLLKYASDKPEKYNKISNDLYKKFHLQSAEISLLCTYYAMEGGSIINGSKTQI